LGGGGSSALPEIRLGNADNTIKKIKFINGMKNKLAKKVGAPIARNRLTVKRTPI
jgi:hypothetical protein